MKIEYKILWLDDNIDNFVDDGYITDIQIFLEDKGFAPIIDTNDDVETFLGKLNDTYDLILTDYHLNDENRGDSVVSKIRDQEIFTEILFYTARREESLVRPHLDRISFFDSSTELGSHYELIVSKIKKMIGLTIMKFEHIVSMRGLIMEETSALDELMSSILIQYIDTCSEDENIQEIAAYLFSELTTHFTSKCGKISKWSNMADKRKALNFLMKDNFVFSASYKILALSKLISFLGDEDFSQEYNLEINSERNKFAHAVLKSDGIRSFFQGKEDQIIYDSDYCVSIRKNITKHRARLDGIRDKLTLLFSKPSIS